MTKVTIQDQLLTIIPHMYQADNTTAIFFETEYGEEFGVLTTCIPDANTTLEDDEIIVKLYSENRIFFELLEGEVFEETYKMAFLGANMFNIWKINDTKLLEEIKKLKSVEMAS